jgi:hypothetical protein
MRVKDTFVILLDTHGLSAFTAFDNHFDLSIVLPLSLQYTSDRSDLEDLVFARFVDRCVVLRGEEDVSLTGHCFLERFNGAGPSDLERAIAYRRMSEGI